MAALFIAVATLACGHQAGSAPPPLSLKVCRAHVTPCQQELSIPQGGSAILDLAVHRNTPELPGEGFGGLLAWETHFLLSSDAATLQLAGGVPVQSQGDPELVLDGLSELNERDVPGIRYFPVQNRYDTGSGGLDYAVTLIGPDSPQAWPGIPLAASGQGTVLGRVHLEGLAPGSVELADTAPGPQLVLSGSTGGPQLVRPSMPSPVATLRVGPVTTAGILGKVEPGLTGNDTHRPFPAEAQVSLWEQAAVPPWQGGSDAPLATFASVALDADGQFRVADIPASLAPPGRCDLRIKLERAVGKAVDGMLLPDASDPAAANLVSVTVPPVSYGDANGDNAINRRDLEMLRDNFALTSNPEEPGNSTDFNFDGITDVADFSVLAVNFGALGE